MGKWFKRTLLAALLVAVTAVCGFYYLVHRSDSAIQGTLLIDAVSQPVRIIRDEYGIPHIFAQNRKDLAFAFGYVEAQDRLWQLDVNRHLVTGTLSSFLGPEALESDLFVRTVGLEDAARGALQAVSPDTRSEMEAFARGVNAFVEMHPGKLPLEFFLTHHRFESLDATDCARTGTLLAWALSLNFNDEMLAAKIGGKIDPSLLDQLFPLPPETILPGEAGSRSAIANLNWISPRGESNGTPFSQISKDSLLRLGRDLAAVPSQILGISAGIPASNNWVVAGPRTTTGKPILANDPHLPLGMPSIWYEVHLVAPGLDVVGAAVPGLPYVSVGHNRRIAFGFTNVMTDNQDLFVEKVNPTNRRQVWFVNRWEDMRSEFVSIPIKGQTMIQKEILHTRHGPVITPVRPGLKETLAMRWVGQEPSRSIEGFRVLNVASKWEEARAAVRNFSETSLNLAYADVEGNVGWQVTGSIPIRAKGDGHFPVPGWTGEYEWKGTVPFEELPSYYLPAGSSEPVVTGSLHARVPSYALATANQRSVHSDYKYPISNAWAAPYRFLRISQMLGRKEKMSVQDIQDYQADRHPLLAETFLQILEEVSADTEDLRWALKTLKEWDGQVTKESAAAALYELTLSHLMGNAYADELGDLCGEYASKFGAFYTGMDAMIHDPMAKWWDDVRTPVVETRKDILRRSLLDAMAEGRRRIGSNASRWRWGDLHHAVFANVLGRRWPLNQMLKRSIPCGGDGNTVNNGFYAVNRPFDVAWASSYRMVVDLSDMAHALAINTTGQSGRPFTCHYGDMIQDWADVKYHPMWMDENDIMAHARGTLILQPSQIRGLRSLSPKF